MKYFLNERPVEVEKVESNHDGSRFITKAGYIDGAQEELTSDELDELQNFYDDSESLNGLWRE